jgi:hypothetical protein
MHQSVFNNLKVKKHTKRLLNFLARREETEVDEGGHGDSRNGIPLELANELEREEAEVDPDSMSTKWINKPVGQSVLLCDIPDVNGVNTGGFSEYMQATN